MAIIGPTNPQIVPSSNDIQQLRIKEIYIYIYIYIITDMNHTKKLIPYDAWLLTKCSFHNNYSEFQQIQQQLEQEDLHEINTMRLLLKTWYIYDSVVEDNTVQCSNMHFHALGLTHAH